MRTHGANEKARDDVTCKEEQSDIAVLQRFFEVLEGLIHLPIGAIQLGCDRETALLQLIGNTRGVSPHCR